ncbi:fructose bisphosphate aldolase [Catenisphaera adipataccumulans]|uniref:fructose-bisphosphate aldolase n=1 Tax=Catenisphaera adipataccumulans TaxID=700500 RepID=A0A7W8FVY5_9FIRM|nr:fructose bisphosphate aldolase [Catenisphaera adipataccumulans]MBB5183668.1 fructose-bisphosphate aldolase class I [Catenisphaera adipataccumulans]
MNQKQFDRMHTGKGFIAALDQSGGSTPKALRAYGLSDDAWHNDDEMFDLVHQMRTRIMTSPSFTSDRILAAILFENTMDRKVEGQYTADYLWNTKGIIPILKIDKGLKDEENHVRLMKPIPGLDATLEHAVKDRHIFGTKERSVILDYDEKGIAAIVDQQFELGMKVCAHGLVPILEPEVDIHSPHKAECEKLLHDLIMKKLGTLGDEKIMFKLTIPTQADLYTDVIADPHVVRVVALSGGYSQKEACELLKQNHGMIASFSRAFAQNLRYNQTDAEFDAEVKKAADLIYDASIS